MSVQNATYNINYPNMNFGQTIISGLFGSLTGCMGMNGSIFSSFGGGCCGGFGMPMFGGFAMGGYTDQMLGMQIGSSIFNYGTMALGQYMGDRKAAKAAKAQNIDSALKTLNITKKPEELKTDDLQKTSFVTTSYDNEIISKFDSRKNEISSKINSLKKSESDFTARAKAEVGEKPESESQEVYDQKVAAKAKELLEEYNNKNIKPLEDKLQTLASIEILNKCSSELSSDIVGADVISAIKAKEDAEAEFKKAKEILQNYLIDSNRKDYNKQLKKEDLDVNRKSTDAQKECRKLQDDFREALKEYGKNKNEAKRTELEKAYKALKDSDNENITQGYKTTASNAMKTFGLES